MKVSFDGDTGAVMQFSSIAQIAASHQGFLTQQSHSLWNESPYVSDDSRQMKNFRHLRQKCCIMINNYSEDPHLCQTNLALCSPSYFYDSPAVFLNLAV